VEYNLINSLLIPTDFGELGDYAYSIAARISAKSGAAIEVISVVTGPPGAFYSKTGELLKDEGNDYAEWDSALAAAQEKMKQWVKDKPEVTDTFCTIGNIDQTILQYATNHQIDLIVMGTHGLFHNSIWGPFSHAEFITNHSPIPVLTLKCDRTDLKLDELLLVSDFLEAKPINLSIIKSLQALHGSKLLLLKIKLADTRRTEAQITADMHAFAQANRLQNYEVHIYPDQLVEAGIGKFAAEKDIDLIMLGTHQAGTFSKLFRESISKDVVNHLYHPILTFPLD